MAKYIGTLTSDARGKIGGIVMTRARNGTNLKAHKVGVNTRSPFQLSLRSTFATALAAWNLIPGSDRTAWGLLAFQYTYVNTLGQAYSPTGLQLWTQAYMNAMLSGTTPPTTPPTSPPFINQIVDVSLTRIGSQLNLKAFESGGGNYPGAWTASLSSVIAPTRNYLTPIRRRPMGFINIGATIDISTRWVTAYGRLPLADQYVSVRAVPYDPASYISATPFLTAVFVL